MCNITEIGVLSRDFHEAGGVGAPSASVSSSCKTTENLNTFKDSTTKKDV